MDIVIIVVQFFLSLSILVILHELGHFIAARAFDTKVEKFYLFFNPWFSLVKKKVGDTEYGIGWLPLGGYVKITGMIDESMDKEQMQGPPQPWEFRSKPTWQRLIIMLGGVVVNFILGFLIFGLVLWTYGEKYIPTDAIEYGYHVDELGEEMGLQEGDKILKVGSKEFEKYDPGMIKTEIIINEARTILVERNNEEVTVNIAPEWTGRLASYANKDATLIYPRIPSVIKEIAEDSPGEEAGLREGDRITGLNGISTPFYAEFQKAMADIEDQSITLSILRDGHSIDVPITLDDDQKIGISMMGLTEHFPVEREDFTLLEALPAGVAKGYNFLSAQIKAFGKMFQGKIKASDSLGGFGTIGSLFPNYWDWERFWNITAILSLILGFMNLLPIPALDGGHVMFLLYEMVTGKRPSDTFMEYATIVGFVIVIALVLYANGLDILRWFNRGG